MLIGREAEKAQIGRMLEEAAAGRGGALLVRGEAGMGKTALLDRAVEAANGFRVLYALGVEFEAELPFAALHELVQPVLHLLDELPEPQSKAIKAALALEQMEPPDRFSAYAATLGLLAAAATERPLLCVVDDAHWLDQASAEALLFAARRIGHDSVALLLTVRDPAPASFSALGLVELRLGGLASEHAKALLAIRAPSLVPAAVDRVVKAARGNPLALLEFAPGATDAAGLEEPLPVSETVERAFVERSSMLSQESRQALLLVATGQGEPDVLWAALEAEALTASLAEAEQAALIVRGQGRDFSHPLARSAIYQSATPSERRDAHRVLAAHTTEPDRRAWHLAGAAVGPDETVAAALEQAASQARKRGGVSAEATALERAARLSPDPEARARRLFRAGLAAEAAGRLERAEELLAEAAELTADPGRQADAIARRSYLVFDRGEFDRALELATAGAERAPRHFSRVATDVLVHRLDISSALQRSVRAAELVGDGLLDDLELCVVLTWAWELSGQREEALTLTRACAERVELGTVLAIDFANRFFYGEDYPAARDHFERVIAHERGVGALGNLAYAIDNFCLLEARTGPLAPAYVLALEALQLTEPLGNDVALAACLGRLALIEALLGRSADAHEHGRRSLQVSEQRGDRWNAVRARAALGAEALARGDVAAAAEWLEPAGRMLAAGGFRQPNVFRIDGDLIEAQLRIGEVEGASRRLADLFELGERTGSPWTRAVAARCRALLVEDADAAEAFETALKLHEHEPSEWELARTQLAYGQRLRRLRHRRAAREQLHPALEAFERLGSRPWADRARAELRASGERLKRRNPAAHEQLTSQELQVSLAAADGLTSKEIGARLFLSPKTVDFHLGRAYRKLEVRSRGELIKLFAGESVPAERLPA